MELLKEIAKQVFNLVAVLLMVFFIFLCGFAFAEAEACVKRSYLAKAEFKRNNPKPPAPCVEWWIDHIEPLDCGGADAPENMQWQCKPDAMAKDKWERIGCVDGARLFGRVIGRGQNIYIK